MNTAALDTILHPLAPAWSVKNQISACALSPFWRDWLLDHGSLTARLSASGRFSVRIVRQHFGRPSPLERQRLKLNHSARVWVREVVLSVNDIPLVYARTAVPLTTLRGKECRLRNLGEKSLGSYLFSQPDLHRHPLAVSHCNPNALGLEWCRHSVFTLGEKPLLVSEAFSARLGEII